MKLILRADVDGLGKRGDIVDVADGYGRNYLLPRGLAFVATAGAVDQAAKMRRARDLRDAHDREAAQTVATTLVPKVITVAAKAGREGRLFGSVTTADVVDAVREQTGIELERRQLDSEPIKTLGQHVVTARLHSRRGLSDHRRRRSARVSGDERGSDVHSLVPRTSGLPTRFPAPPLAAHRRSLARVTPDGPAGGSAD